MEAIETIKVKDGFTVELHHDENPINPRVDYDELSTMVCFHDHYELGNKQEEYCHVNGRMVQGAKVVTDLNDLKKQIQKDHRPAVILPLYMLDHSGLAINTTGFSCPWDSGQIGFVFVKREDALKEYSAKRISKKIREQAEKVLQAEVNTYDQYLRGECYGYQVKDADGEVVESCWGFLGDIDYCKQEALAAGKSEAAEAKRLSEFENGAGI